MSVYQTLVTTATFNKGRVAARRDMLRVYGPVTINPAVANVLPAEFVAGYKFEIGEFDMLPEAIRKSQLSHWQHNGTDL